MNFDSKDLSKCNYLLYLFHHFFILCLNWLILSIFYDRYYSLFLVQIKNPFIFRICLFMYYKYFKISNILNYNLIKKLNFKKHKNKLLIKIRLNIYLNLYALITRIILINVI